MTDGERVLLTRRQPGEHLEGLLEFPGGKVELEEPANEAARRELLEETGLDLPTAAFAPLTFVHWNYGPGNGSGADKRVLLLAFLARVDATSAAGVAKGREAAWYPLAGLAQLTLPPANKRIVEVLLARARGAWPPAAPDARITLEK